MFLFLHVCCAELAVFIPVLSGSGHLTERKAEHKNNKEREKQSDLSVFPTPSSQGIPQFVFLFNRLWNKGKPANDSWLYQYYLLIVKNKPDKTLTFKASARQQLEFSYFMDSFQFKTKSMKSFTHRDLL